MQTYTYDRAGNGVAKVVSIEGSFRDPRIRLPSGRADDLGVQPKAVRS